MLSATPEVSAVLPPSHGVRVGRQVLYACLCFSFLLPLAAVALTLGLPATQAVHVRADGRTLTFQSSAQTVRDVLAASKIPVHRDDVVTPALDTRVWSGIQISVVRPVPVVVTAGGQRLVRQVPAETVAGALAALGVHLGPLDKVYPDPHAALGPGLRITIERRESRTWKEYGSIPFTSRVVNDGSLFKGNTVVRSVGRPGMKERTIRALYADGHAVGVTALAWNVAEAPMPRVIAVGTRAMIASRGAFAGREYLTLEATAYYPGPNNFGGAVGPRTATGMLAQRGIVAVDPSLIPLGTRLYIEGYGYAVAGDTGGAIQGRRIDLCYNTYDEAMRFGRQQVRVYILSDH